MKNLLIELDDPIERLLYGEPDPWLALHECRETGGNNNLDFAHFQAA